MRAKPWTFPDPFIHYNYEYGKEAGGPKVSTDTSVHSDDGTKNEHAYKNPLILFSKTSSILGCPGTRAMNVWLLLSKTLTITFKKKKRQWEKISQLGFLLWGLIELPVYSQMSVLKEKSLSHTLDKGQPVIPPDQCPRRVPGQTANQLLSLSYWKSFKVLWNDS